MKKIVITLFLLGRIADLLTTHLCAGYMETSILGQNFVMLCAINVALMVILVLLYLRFDIVEYIAQKYKQLPQQVKYKQYVTYMLYSRMTVHNYIAENMDNKMMAFLLVHSVFYSIIPLSFLAAASNARLYLKGHSFIDALPPQYVPYGVTAVLVVCVLVSSFGILHYNYKYEKS